jgi:hypothetical protein
VQAPSSQPVYFAEVAPSTASSWRAGVNQVPEGLADKMHELLRKDLQTYSPLTGYLALCFCIDLIEQQSSENVHIFTA